jgi:hypothetical protein
MKPKQSLWSLKEVLCGIYIECGQRMKNSSESLKETGAVYNSTVEDQICCFNRAEIENQLDFLSLSVKLCLQNLICDPEFWNSSNHKNNK